jgi:O-Antigen ligase
VATSARASTPLWRTGALTAARFVLLAGPAAIAFFSGGYFDEVRAWAGLGAWLLVVVAVVAEPRAVPRSRPGWLALGGLSLFAAWTLLSITWAPIGGSAYHQGQLVVLYVGGLLAAAALLRSRAAQRAVEPALAAGALIVIGYGLSERFLPGLLHFQESFATFGRLEQPLTYWNATGELAALGYVLCARIAGDATLEIMLRALAAAAAAPLGMGLYLSLSRGALFAWAAGLVTLVVLAPPREQLRAILLTILAGALTLPASAPFKGLTTLSGSLSTRELQGAISLALLVLIVVATGGTQALVARRELSGPLRLPRRASAIALALICAGLAAAIVLGANEKAGATLSGGGGRLTTLQSDRYAYWRVAMRAFGAQPLHGVGAGGWTVWWLRYRPNDDFAQDAHSLPIQTLAELGVVGLALLAAFLAGIGWAARRALRAAPVLAAGPIAGFVTYVAHSPLDWDWQLPAVTLVAIVLGGALIALAEPARDGMPDEDWDAEGGEIGAQRELAPAQS